MERPVVVVHRRSMPGGNTSMFSREGHQFDIGLHYLGCWRVFHPGIRAVLEPLGIDLRYRELDADGFDDIHFPGMTFRVPNGVEEYRARLYDAFPDERLAVDRYLRRAQAISDEIEAMAPVNVGVRSLAQMPWRTPMTSLTSRMTLGREFDRLGCSPRLRTDLGWAHAYYGLAPARAALALHATAAITYLAGTFYPEGGGPAIVDALVDVSRDHGGEILLDAEVEQILVDGDGVQGVRIAGGNGAAGGELRAPAVVSADDLITSASLKDPTNAGLCGPGQTNLQILGTAPASHDFWGTGAAYARRKQKVRDALLATAERAIPGLTASIVHEETASPLTWERQLRCSGGTGYGITATPDQYLLRRPGPTTRIPACAWPATAPAMATASSAWRSAAWTPQQRSPARRHGPTCTPSRRKRRRRCTPLRRRDECNRRRGPATDGSMYPGRRGRADLLRRARAKPRPARPTSSKGAIQIEARRR